MRAWEAAAEIARHPYVDDETPYKVVKGTNATYRFRGTQLEKYSGGTWLSTTGAHFDCWDERIVRTVDPMQLETCGEATMTDKLLSAEKVLGELFGLRKRLIVGEFDAEPLAALVRARRQRDEAVAQLTELREAAKRLSGLVLNDGRVSHDMTHIDEANENLRAILARQKGGEL